VLALSYWRQGDRRTSSFGLFTLTCAAAFLTNIVSALFLTEGWLIDITQAVCTGLLPPMMLHVSVESFTARRSKTFPLFWRTVTCVMYVTALTLAVARGLKPSDALDSAAGFMLAVVAASALCFLVRWQQYPSCAARQERRWMMGIFAALLFCAVAELATDQPALAVLPDYLVLTFFAVRLFYSERLTFFDVFLKGGAYFAVGTLLLTLAIAAGAVSESFPLREWPLVWGTALALLPIWLVAPLVSRRLSSWVDRSVLNRRYGHIEAERIFTKALQAANTQQQLSEHAVTALEEIFRCQADVEFCRAFEQQPWDLVARIVPAGAIRLHVRDGGSPFLSEDQRSLETLALILGAALHNIELRCLREEQRLREQELKALTTRAELRALRAQINPHFLFNALNAVAGCIRTRPDQADDTLMQLAEVFRYTLSRSENEWVRLGEELDFLRSYLAVEQTRFGDRLHTSIKSDRSIHSLLIPAMIVQPLVENAIRHGTSRQTSIGKVAVEVIHRNGTLRVQVSDNGPGFPAAFNMEQPGVGHGLRNVVERLQKYYGAAGGCTWQNSAVSTTVILSFPTETID
jgi:signal transduction histidine kinase